MIAKLRCWSTTRKKQRCSGSAINENFTFGACSVMLSLGIATTILCNVSLIYGQGPPITDLAFSPDGKLLVCCSQRGLQVFSWPALKLQKTIEVSSANLRCLAFSLEGTRLALGGGDPAVDGVVEVFSWPTLQPQMKLSGHDDSVSALVWQGDSKLVSASLDRNLIYWDLESQEAIRTLRGHSRAVRAACFLSQNELVTAGSDHSVRVWNVDTGELLRSLNQHSKPVSAMQMRPLSIGLPMVATAAGDRSIRFWQPTIGRMMRYIRLDSKPLDIAWIDEARIVASCVDGGLRVIDSDNVSVLQTIPALQEWAYAIAVHPTDATLAIGGSNGLIRRLQLPALDAATKE
ncbi:MAG: WD40 repeat domain-containing protein [Planctomycetota bacterium]